MFKSKNTKKYTCSECYSVVEIKVISNKSEEHDKVQYCPFCGDYLDLDAVGNKDNEIPLLKDFDDYDEFDEEKYYDDFEDDVDDSDE